MTTAKQIVDGAAEEIGVKTAEIALEADDFRVILNRMNDLLMEWQSLGYVQSFAEVSDQAATVEIDRGAVAAVKYALAMRCASAFQKPISQGLAAMAQESLSHLQASTAYIGPVALPDTLPMGIANQCGRYDDTFAPVNESENF